MRVRFGYKLFAPKEFWESNWNDFFLSCNGCGNDSTKNITKGWWNMDLILGVNVRPACAIHDWQYASPKILKIKASHEHRMTCERIFLNNLLRICKKEGDLKKSWAITKWAREKMCWAYFLSVKYFGGRAYWKTNNNEDE